MCFPNETDELYRILAEPDYIDRVIGLLKPELHRGHRFGCRAGELTRTVDENGNAEKYPCTCAEWVSELHAPPPITERVMMPRQDDAFDRDSQATGV